MGTCSFKDLRIFNLNFEFNMIKGRLAEAIIEQLFLVHNFNVARFGIENSVPSPFRKQCFNAIAKTKTGTFNSVGSSNT